MRDLDWEVLRRQPLIQLSAVAVGRALRPLGLDTPLRRAWQQTPVESVKRKQTRYLAFRRRAKRENGQIYFAHESGVRCDYHASRPLGR